MQDNIKNLFIKVGTSGDLKQLQDLYEKYHQDTFLKEALVYAIEEQRSSYDPREHMKYNSMITWIVSELNFNLK